MKKIISVLVLLSFVLINSNSFSYSSDPKIFISELANDAISTLSNKDISIVDKKKKIEIIALENVDINALSMYTLGEIRKTLPEDKIKEYKTLFTNQNFEVLDADQKSEAYTIVNSRILKSSTQPEVKISWRVYTKNIEKPLIRDLIFEGLSLAKTQKEEFKSILSSNNNNIDILFFKLEEFIKK